MYIIGGFVKKSEIYFGRFYRKTKNWNDLFYQQLHCFISSQLLCFSLYQLSFPPCSISRDPDTDHPFLIGGLDMSQ